MTNPTRQEMLHQIIKKRRKQSGLTQIELSILSGVDYNTLRKIETGKSKNPGILTILPIFNALNIDMWEFGRLLGYDFQGSKFAIKY